MASSQKVILATFATEGPPYDNGLPIAQDCLEPYVKAVLKSGVDEVILSLLEQCQRLWEMM